MVLLVLLVCSCWLRILELDPDFHSSGVDLGMTSSFLVSVHRVARWVFVASVRGVWPLMSKGVLRCCFGWTCVRFVVFALVARLLADSVLSRTFAVREADTCLDWKAWSLCGCEWTLMIRLCLRLLKIDFDERQGSGAWLEEDPRWIVF